MKIFLDLSSLIVAALVAGRLIDASPRDPTPIILVILCLLLTSAALTIIFTPEEATRLGPDRGRRTARAAAGPEAGVRASYAWLIAERALFLLGIYGLQAFGQYYLQDVLRVPDPPRQAGNLVAIIGAGVIVLVLAGGWLTDRLGARSVLLAGSGLATLGLLSMVLASDLAALLPSAAVVGAGIGLFLTSNWALANRLAPRAEAGKFLGLTNLATAGSAALARLEGPAIDSLNALRPGDWIGYKGIFIFGAFCILASLACLRKIKSTG